jgi:hypothetical protein
MHRGSRRGVFMLWVLVFHVGEADSVACWATCLVSFFALG